MCSDSGEKMSVELTGIMRQSFAGVDLNENDSACMENRCMKSDIKTNQISKQRRIYHGISGDFNRQSGV